MEKGPGGAGRNPDGSFESIWITHEAVTHAVSAAQPIADCRLPIADCRLPIADCRLPMIFIIRYGRASQAEVIVSAEIYYGDESDANTLLDSVGTAQGNLQQADSDAEIKEAVADNGYHKNETLGKCRAEELRTYICEPDGPQRRWTDKPAEYESACRANRRRLKGDRNKRLQKLRCERVERSFAHVCETGGARRTWLRGLKNNRKNVRIKVAAHNLALILRKLLGSGKPSAFAGLCGQLLSLFLTLQIATSQLYRSVIAPCSLNRLRRCCNHFPLHVTTAVI